jgi:TatD DNase family protein
MIDSHCHLDYYLGEHNEFIRFAKDQGVLGMLTVSTKLSNIDDLKTIAQTNKNLWYSVGVHPSEAVSVSLEDLSSFLHDEKVVAIGETGLDYFHKTIDKNLQIKNFEAHLMACQKFDLPIIIHTRNADEDTLSALDHFPSVKGVFHCFTGSYDFAKSALDRGFKISFSGIITFKNALDLRDVVSKIPIESILIETDAPYLTPEPYRGQKNEPAHVLLVAKKIAEIKACALEDVKDITTKNFFETFKKAHLEAEI